MLFLLHLKSLTITLEVKILKTILILVKFNEYMLSIDIQFGHGGLLARPAPVLLDKFPASIEAA